MKTTFRIAALIVAALSSALAQNATTNTSVPTTCINGFKPGRDEVLYTVPYTYDQVLSIIGNYSNLTWSGSPPGSVSLDGPDNTVGTTRTYDLSGAHIVEKILTYSKPGAPGPYNEVHTTAMLTVPTANNVSFYIPYDGTVVTSVCDGKASMFNFTAAFCGSDVAMAAQVLHMLHMTDAVMVGTFLGGNNYTSCAALGSNAMGPANATAPAATGTTGGSSPSGSAPEMQTGSAVRYSAGLFSGVVGVVVGVMML